MNEANIPIDIHALKLQDWLVSRRIVPKNAQIFIKQIRSKIENLLRDSSNNDLIATLGQESLFGANINYYNCKEIIEILKQTEKETRNMFGSYGSQRMKDWQEIVRLYEKDNVYLGETAQIYVRNVNYEVPGLRKQMAKLEQQVDECQKRIQELDKPEAQLQAEHASLLQKLGIKGDNLRTEFIEVLGNLPEIYRNSIRYIGALKKAAELYAECSGQNPCLPILMHVIEFGNTTVYQYIHKKAPLTVEEPPFNLHFNDKDTFLSETNVDNVIDFDNIVIGGTGSGSTTAIPELIDFDEGNSLETDGTDIDWGIESTSVDEVQIDFDIPTEGFDIVENVSGHGGVAKGDQSYTILDSPVYRDRFLDEIHELASFLRMRLYELHQSHASNNIMFSLMDNISAHDAESIQRMIDDIESIIQDTCSEQTHHLFQLKHSPKYADLLKAKLNKMTKAVHKIRATKKALGERIIQLKQERQDIHPVFEQLLAVTKQLEINIEQDISRRYKSRVVNLLGGMH